MRILMLALLSAMLVGCIAALPPPQATRSFSLGELQFEEEFDQPGNWDTYNLEGVFLNIEDGAYHMQVSLEDRYVWGLNREAHDNAVIETEVFLRSDYERSIMGIMCRASSQNNSRGYFFLISANGNFSIRRSDGTALEPLVRWQPSTAIRLGSDRNRLRAVCVGDYLAFYINGEFVAETRDHLYRAGFAGLAVGVAGTGDVDAVFDHVSIWEANLR